MNKFGRLFFNPLAILSILTRDAFRNPALDAAVIGAVQSTTVCGLFLVDALLLSDTADSPAKADADVEGHRLPS